jgi:hypothetical protein
VARANYEISFEPSERYESVRKSGVKPPCALALAFVVAA